MGSVKCNDFTITDTTGKELWSRKFDVNPYQREQDVFVESIRNNSGINTVEIGANVALTSLMGRTAAILGRPVTRDEVLNSKEALFPDTKLSWDTPPPTLPDKLGDYRFPAKGR